MMSAAHAPSTIARSPRRSSFRLGWVLVAFSALVLPGPAEAFCGVFVGAAGAKLYNESSQVALARVKDRTTITMRNDYRGKAERFAMVIPVPVVLKKDDVRTRSPALFDRLDTFSAPRLVEYFEQDPCSAGIGLGSAGGCPNCGGGILRMVGAGGAGVDLGVTVVEEFSVDEYEIQILSAKESTGLERWLRKEGYSLPKESAPILAPYVKKQMLFFAAKVDPKKVDKRQDGTAVLSPLQFTFTSPTFELPIRLGMINSTGLQDLIVYVLTDDKRAEVVNYPTVFVPTDVELGDRVPGQKGKQTPTEAFGSYYISLFNTAQDDAGGAAVVTEYVWSTNHCDPCPTPPLTADEMRSLGLASGGGVITRLHARYSNKLFKDDFALGLAEHRKNFQGRYILRHPWKGEIKCKEPVRGIWGAAKTDAMIGSMSRRPAPRVARSIQNVFGSSRPKANVTVTAEVVDGDIDKAGISRLLRRRKGAFQACFEVELKKDPKAAGKVRLQLIIGPKGRAKQVGALSNQLGRPAAKCFAGVLKRLRYPVPEGDPAEVVVMVEGKPR